MAVEKRDHISQKHYISPKLPMKLCNFTLNFKIGFKQ